MLYKIYFIFIILNIMISAKEFTCNTSDTTYLDKDTIIVKYKCYKNGAKKKIIRYKNGVYSGLTESWYENGEKSSSVKYNNYEYDGSVKGWYENGLIRTDKKYINGMAIDTHKVWYENGNMKELTVYDSLGIINPLKPEGKRLATKEGLNQKWYENGQVSDSLIFKKDYPVEEFFWYTNGKLKMHRTNRLADINKTGSGLYYISGESFDVNGKKLGTFKNGNGSLKIFDEKNQKYRTMIFKDGKGRSSDFE